MEHGFQGSKAKEKSARKKRKVLFGVSHGDDGCSDR